MRKALSFCLLVFGVATSPYCSEFVVNARCPYQKGYCLDRFVGIKYCPTCNQCKAGEKCV